MKKAYVRPTMNAEMFVANEYVAACWDISCNVPYGIGYLETNGEVGYQAGGDVKLVSASSGCNKVHQAKGINAAGPTANAMWQPITTIHNDNGTPLNPFDDFYSEEYGTPYAVFHFSAKGGTGEHFCTLDSVNWDKNPNASN